MAIGLITPGANADDVQTLLDAKASSSSVTSGLALKADLASPVFTGRIDLPSYTLATLPAVGAAGGLIFVSDADSAKGAVCFSDGVDWIDTKTHLAVA